MKFLNLFSLVLLFVWQVSAGKCTGRQKNAKRFSSKNDDDSDHQQKLTNESQSPNIVPDKSLESQHSSSDTKNVCISNSEPLMLPDSTSQSSKVDIEHESNSTKPKLEPEDTDIKTTNPIESEPLISSEENTPKEKNLNDVLEQIAGTPPIQDLFFKHFTNIYSVDHKTKTLILYGDNSSEGFSWQVYVLRVCYSKLSIKTLIFKNLTIGRKIFETITFFLSCYRNTLEVLIFDHCFFSSKFAIQDDFQLKSLHTARITYCALNEEILKNTLSLFPSSLQTLELSHLCKNSFINKYKHYGPYLTLNFSGLNVNRFSKLKNLYVKRNDIMNFKVENFTNLEEIEANDKICKLFDSNRTELEKLGKLKKISSESYIFTNRLNYFAERSIVIDNGKRATIMHTDLPNISKILSILTDILFCFTKFTANDINLVPLKNESKFEHLKSVAFSDFNNTYNIAFMICILNRFHSIRTITVMLIIENITAQQIAELFNDVDSYDNIENVNFEIEAFTDITTACEFIIQILRRVPNLKYLSFKNMKTDVMDILFNRLQEEKLRFLNLKKIDTKNYVGSINLLLWFMQTSPIEELNIDSDKLTCSSNEVLNAFSTQTIRRLIIGGKITTNDVFKKYLDGMVNLKELHFKSRPDLIALFKNNSTIEKVVFECYPFYSKHSEGFLAIMKTFKSLKCIYVKNDEKVHFKKQKVEEDKKVEGREVENKKVEDKKDMDKDVELIFYSEPLYFL